MARFEAAYQSDSKLKKLVGVAASHHRLAWIHPFLDGNGRVARSRTIRCRLPKSQGRDEPPERCATQWSASACEK